jgi:biotin carboxyl carrier protein
VRTFQLVIDGKTYRVEIGDTTERPIEVIVNGATYLVEALGGEPQKADRGVPAPASPAVSRQAAAPQSARPRAVDRVEIAEGTRVTAPMPGKILSIKVSVGEQVDTKDVVCTLEAMKMEMAINATTNGKIVQINVEAGQTVNHGDTLCVIG